MPASLSRSASSLSLDAAVDHGRHVSPLQVFDLPRSECAADSYLGSDLRKVQLLRLQISGPLHQPGQDPQPEPTQRLPEFRVKLAI